MTPMESKLLTKPPLEKMRPFEWLYWAFLDAGMEREAEGMQWALMSFRGARAEANWQANRRAEVEQQRDALVHAILLHQADVRYATQGAALSLADDALYKALKVGADRTATEGK